MIRNIVFDMGNVLIRWCPEVFIDRLGIPEEDRPALLQEVFTSVDWMQLDRGIVTWQEAAARMCRRLPERLHIRAAASSRVTIPRSSWIQFTSPKTSWRRRDWSSSGTPSR